MSNETAIEQEDRELEEMRKQLEAAEAEKNQAAEPVVEEPPTETPSPEPVTPEPESAEAPQPPVTPQESKPESTPDKDDPMEWAKKKGFKSPEDMARALLQKENEFHKRNQAGHPGYQDLSRDNPNPPPAPNWAPRPDYGYQQPPPMYAPPVQRGDNFGQLAALYPNIDPEDLKRFMPVVLDAAQAAARRERMELEQRFGHIERSTARNNELMTLMQDPAFKTEMVQQEIDSIIDKDPSIFQRERHPLVFAFEKALSNLGRKQLQQGVTPEKEPRKSTPPLTAGGGNGSANTAPFRITDAIFETWTDKEQDAYMKSNGKIVPKR
jgi:hypothetical protein